MKDYSEGFAGEYICHKCADSWGFFPEDYDWDETAFPTYCPLCTMPVWDMIKEVWKEEGLLEVIKRIYIRL